MSLMSQEQASKIWIQASEKVKDRIVAPTLYRALEVAVGVTLDGDEFVLGFSNPDLPMSGHLRSSQYQSVIEQSISEIIGKKTRLFFLEGTTITDYQNFRNSRKVIESAKSKVSTKREEERVIEIEWETVAEQITRGYSKMHLRTYAQQRAQFMKSAFKIISDAIDNLNYTENSQELEKRCLARVLDKLSGCVELPSSFLAYELFKLRDEGKL